MPFGVTRLDGDTLARLRRFVKAMHMGRRASVPTDQLVRLASEVQLEAGVTIDFEASRDLGHPLVVLRVPFQAGPAACLDGLSAREREIVVLIADGLSNKQIARRVHLSLATIKDHVHRILTKSGLPNRAAVASAQRGYEPAVAS